MKSLTATKPLTTINALTCDSMQIKGNLLVIKYSNEMVDALKDKLLNIKIHNRTSVIYSSPITREQITSCTLVIDINKCSKMLPDTPYYIYVSSKLYKYKLLLTADAVIQFNKEVENSAKTFQKLSKKAGNMAIFPVFGIRQHIGIEKNSKDNMNHFKHEYLQTDDTFAENVTYDNDTFHINLNASDLILPNSCCSIALFNPDHEMVWCGPQLEVLDQIHLSIPEMLPEIEILHKNKVALYIVYKIDNLSFISFFKVFIQEYEHVSERYFPEYKIPTPYLNEDGLEMTLYCLPFIRKDYRLGIFFCDKLSITEEQSDVTETTVKIGRTSLRLQSSLDLKDGKPSRLILVHRNNPDTENITLPISSQLDNDGYYHVKAVIPCKGIPFEQFYWDLYYEIALGDEAYMLRVRNQTPHTRKMYYNTIKPPITFNDFILMPFTSRYNTLSLLYRQKNEFDKIKYKIMEHFAFTLFKLTKRWMKKKNIWIVYEKYCASAQDNGYYFFKHCMEKMKADNVYYVIDKNCNDYQKIAKFDKNVLHFMSFKHMLYAMSATLMVSSEAKSHCFGWRKQNSRVLRTLYKKRLVFLQHGVIGLKKVDDVYRKSGANPASLFVTSSDYEKGLIHDYFEYNNEEIIVTGLCRWDVLEDRSEGKKEILLMPTWRNWLDEVSTEEFMKSDYYINYSQILNNKKLQQLLLDENIHIQFYIHPKFKDYMKDFTTTNEHIHLIPFGEQPLNELIMSCSMLITDYSSVAWDVYYQGKPTIFYQFDYEDYDEKQGSYMDMDTEIFGDRVFKVTDLIDTIQEYIHNNFEEKAEYIEKRDGYFKWRDHNNSQRVVNEIENYLEI